MSHARHLRRDPRDPGRLRDPLPAALPLRALAREEAAAVKQPEVVGLAEIAQLAGVKRTRPVEGRLRGCETNARTRGAICPTRKTDWTTRICRPPAALR